MVIKEWIWATVISWKDNIATLYIDEKISCNNCSSHKICNNLLKTMELNKKNLIQICNDEQLYQGQRVKLRIKEKSLLGSVLFVYTIPLIGLFLISVLFKILFFTDVAAAFGAILGNIFGFSISKNIFSRFNSWKNFQPIIIESFIS